MLSKGHDRFRDLGSAWRPSSRCTSSHRDGIRATSGRCRRPPSPHASHRATAHSRDSTTCGQPARLSAHGPAREEMVVRTPGPGSGRRPPPARHRRPTRPLPTQADPHRPARPGRTREVHRVPHRGRWEVPSPAKVTATQAPSEVEKRSITWATLALTRRTGDPEGVAPEPPVSGCPPTAPAMNFNFVPHLRCSRRCSTAPVLSSKIWKAC